MTTLHSVQEPTHATFFENAQAMPLPEVYITRPMIRVPRSATRDYTDSELSTAAAMLAKMKRRGDVIDGLRSRPEPAPINSDGALDRVVDKLLDLI
jgi:hypothetical protein